MKVKLHKQGAQDPRETKSSSEELDNEYDLEFMPNQYTHKNQHKNLILRHTQNQIQESLRRTLYQKALPIKEIQTVRQSNKTNMQTSMCQF